ncbi:hypothetical protein YC2023_117856 [Brassica napus]
MDNMKNDNCLETWIKFRMIRFGESSARGLSREGALDQRRTKRPTRGAAITITRSGFNSGFDPDPIRKSGYPEGPNPDIRRGRIRIRIDPNPDPDICRILQFLEGYPTSGYPRTPDPDKDNKIKDPPDTLKFPGYPIRHRPNHYDIDLGVFSHLLQPRPFLGVGICRHVSALNWTTRCEQLPPSDGCWFQTIARKVSEKFHLIGFGKDPNILTLTCVDSQVYSLDWTPEMNQIVSASQQDTLS